MTAVKEKSPKTESEDLLAKFGDKVFDADFWRQYAPAFTIEGKADDSAFTLIKDEKDKYKSKLVREGYIHVYQPGMKAPYEDMTALFDKLVVESGLPPVFAFVYDEYWRLGTQLYNLISSVMDANYAFLPDFWGWRVAPGQAGWTPHRDKGADSLFPNKSPKSLTVWMPLNEAHPLNGCMYVLPADRDKFYGVENPRAFGGTLPDLRALPGKAGDVFAWTQHVFHWGSHSADDHHLPPRMSVAFEFQRLDVPPWNRPLMNPRALPSFEDRLALIAKQVMQYRHMYSFTPDLVALAQKMSDRHKLPADSVDLSKAK